MSDPSPLTAQQRRTRGAIVDAAARLLARGVSPSMAEVAAEAEVARRTVYLYFSTLEQLLIDAVLGQITQVTIEAELLAVDELQDIEERVARTVAAIQESSIATEHLGRTLIRLSTPPQAAETGATPRGYRRVLWLERALAPARARLGPVRWERLISELTVLVGWEALIILRDIRGLTPEEAVDTSVGAAVALVRSVLAATTPAEQPGGRRSADA